MGVTESETPLIVYVKGHEKQEWLQNLLPDDAREDVYIESIDVRRHKSIDVHYEDSK